MEIAIYTIVAGAVLMLIGFFLGYKSLINWLNYSAETASFPSTSFDRPSLFGGWLWLAFVIDFIGGIAFIVGIILLILSFLN